MSITPDWMNYYMDEVQKQHIKTLLRWLFEESISAGGDGDAWWYSQNHSVNNLLSIVKELNNEQYNWTVGCEEHRIVCHHPPEQCVIIMDSEEEFKLIPSWAQVIVKW